MDMNKGHKISINGNPIASKSVRAILTDEKPIDVIAECMNEWMSGVELNEFDMPAYLVALDLIKTSLESTMDDPAQHLYEMMRNDATIITIRDPSKSNNTKDGDQNASEE